MCGVVALFKRKELRWPLALAHAAGGTVAHRGPNGAGLVGFDGGLVFRSPDSTTWEVALAHRRLAILDLSSAAGQPMVYKGRYWLAYNGEVYNYVELRAELEKLGHIFETRSDSEVVLAAFDEWGTSCFQRMRGMWGLILFDTETGTSMVCRDRLGIKPLYMWRGQGVIGVVSEIKQLLGLPTFRASCRQEAAAEFLATGYEDEDATFFRGVTPVPAGTYQLVSRGGESVSSPHPYWWPERVEALIHDPLEAGRLFAAKFDECVRIQLRSDVPVGCTVSGGLDSTAIAVRVHRQQSPTSRLHAFTVSCEEDPKSEADYVQSVLGAIRSEPHRAVPTAESFLEDLDDFVWHHDEPVASLSMYAGYCVAKTIRAAEIPVVMNGQGGDELLSGYWQSYFMYLREIGMSGKLFTLARHFLQAAAPGGNPSLLAQVPVILRRYLARSRGSSILSGSEAGHSKLLQRALATRGQTRRIHEIRTMYLPRLLKWDDRNSMAFSVETRYPFLDHELVELCLSFAPEALYHAGWTKWPLRRGLEAELPPMVANRRSKFGFWVPQDHWLRGPLRPKLGQWLNRDRPLWELVDRDRVRRVAERTWGTGKPSEEIGQHLARCFLLDKWLEIFKVQID